MASPNMLLGQDLVSRLREAGVIPANVRRVVIDAKLDDVVTIYIQQVGTDDLLDALVGPELRGAKVVTSDGNK